MTRTVKLCRWRFGAPLDFVDPMPGYFWYGVHCIEMMVAGMGAGCEKITLVEGVKSDEVVCYWEDGRTAIYHGMKEGHGGFGCVIHREKGTQFIDVTKAPRPFYVSMMEVLVQTLPHGKVAVDADQMLEVVRILELAGNARDVVKA